jgi:hypothetical protein
MLPRRLAYVFALGCFVAAGGCDDSEGPRADASVSLDAGAAADAADGPTAAAPDAGDASVATTDDAARALLEMDCRPRYDDTGQFLPRCQYIQVSGVPAIRCPQLPAPGSVGSIEIVVRHPERITIGVPVSLGGADPAVEISGAYASPRILIQTKDDGPVSGAIVFDELALGSRIRGRLMEVQVTAQPDPPFTCRISNGAFLAEVGAGVGDR